MKTIYLMVPVLGLAGYFAWTQFEKTPAPVASSTEGSSKLNSEKRVEAKRFDWLLDPGLRREIKRERLRQLDPKTLSKAETQELFDLIQHQPDPTRITVVEWASIVNEIMEQIRRHGLNEGNISRTFLAMIRDETLSPLLRDFAAQHLGGWIAVNPVSHGAPRETDPALITEALDTLVGLVTDPDLIQTSIPGTTLRVLGHLHRDGGFPAGARGDASPLTPTFKTWLNSTIAGEQSSPPGLRNCAINAAGLLELQDFRSEIRRLAEDPNAPASIRLTSIATLGHFQQEDDREFLNTLAQSKSRLRFAAQAALKHLEMQ